MSDLIKSMTDALGALDDTLENPDFDLEDEDTSKGDVLFDLEKASDADVMDEFVDVAPFLETIASTVDRNTARLARVTEASLNVIKSQAATIEDLSDRIDTLTSIVERIASEPQPTQGAVTKGRADELLKALEPRAFASPITDQDVGLAPQAPQSLVFAQIKGPVVQTLRKAWSDSQDSIQKSQLGNDLLSIDAVDSMAPSAQVISLLSPAGKETVRSLIETLSTNDPASA